MPRGNGMGPQNQGPMTGRGLGSCNPINAGQGQGLGRGFGQGLGLGIRRGGRGFNFRTNNVVANDVYSKETLLNQKENLQSAIEDIDKQLKDL